MKLNNKTFNVKNFFVKYALFIMIMILWVYFGLNSPHFFSINNVKSLLSNAAPLLVYASGMTFVLILGEIDLSIGSIGAVSASAWMICLTKYNFNLVLSFAIAIFIGILCGTLIGFIIVVLKVNAFMTTIGMLFVLRGVCYLLVDGEQIMTPTVVQEFSKTRILGLSPLVYLSLFIAISMTLVYKYAPYGRKLQACGCNKQAAKMVGINVSKVRWITFIISGALAAFAGTLQCTNFGILLPGSIGEGSEFLAITACVLGGTSLAGGVGTVVPGSLLGVIFYYSIENGLGLLGANVYLYPIVRGIVIYLAMVSDSLKRSIGLKKIS